jgi:hypothetical protein
MTIKVTGNNGVTTTYSFSPEHYAEVAYFYDKEVNSGFLASWKLAD